MLSYVLLFSGFHGEYSLEGTVLCVGDELGCLEGTVLCVGDELGCQPPEGCHLNNIESVQKYAEFLIVQCVIRVCRAG
jgi:hypothetical protein